MAGLGTLNGASCMIAAGTSYNMVDSTDARALDTAGIAALTAYPFRILRASFNSAPQSLKQTVYDRADIGSSTGTPPVVVGAAVDGSGPVVRISGSLTLGFEMRGLGAVAALSNALGIILSSSLADLPRTPGTSQTLTGVGANTGTVAGGDVAEVAAGDIMAITQTDGTYRFCKVTRNNAGDLTFLEPHGITAAATATMRSCHLWYRPVDGTGDGSSVVCQLAHPDGLFTYLLVGGRMSAFKLTQSTASSLDGEVTIDFSDGIYAAAVVIPIAGTDPLPLGVAGTTPLRTLVAPCRVSANHAAEAVPKNTTAADLPLREWSCEVMATLDPNPNQGKRSGVDGASVTVASATGSFTQQAPTSGVDWREVTRLSAKHAAAFTAAGANAAGNGLAVWVGAVECAADPGVTFDDNVRTQVVSWRAGDYVGDYVSGAPEHANAPFVIALVC